MGLTQLGPPRAVADSQAEQYTGRHYRPMKQILSLFLVCTYLAVPLLAQLEPVPKVEAQRWTRHLIPLPKEISIANKVTLPPRGVAIKVDTGTGEIADTAAAELRALFEGKTGRAPAGGSFEIRLALTANPDVRRHVSRELAERLDVLPNHRQAYSITPIQERGLLLAAVDPKGLYYASRTLHQLVEPFLTPERVSIPLATIVDWPDLEERGLWNFPQPAEWVPWMASLKLNYGKMAGTRLKPIERGKPNGVIIDHDLYRSASRMAFEYQPFLTHFNFLHSYGLYRAYPELAGKGDGALAGRYFAHKQGNRHRVPNAAHPLFRKLLVEWLRDFARQGVSEVSCWLSERPGEDGRPETTAVGQDVMESRAIVAAFREVQKEYPKFSIRVFLSTVPTGRYYRVMAELPDDIKIERACATKIERVLHLPRDLLRNPMLDHYAAEGRWIASYDVPITANARVDTPEFMVPESSAHRVRDYVRQLIERRFQGAYGMMAWADNGRATCGFNIHALAEYTWNLDGRSEKEFAVAWATREGYRKPEKVGEWAELMGPIEFDVYDSDFPIAYSWGKAAKMIKERRRPYLGEGIFRYYTSREDFDRKIAAADRAMVMAEGFENKYLANETRVVRSYVRLAKGLYEVAERVATDELRTAESLAALRKSVDGLTAAGEENVEAIRHWRRALDPEPWHYRVHDAIKGTEETVKAVREFVTGRYL